MAALSNPKHERFAQELAKGKSATKAYTAAGYKGDRGNAVRLTTNDSVQARLAELQGKAAEKTVVTVEGLISRFNDIAGQAAAANQFGPAATAVTAIAKLSGLWIERSEAKNENVNYVISDEPLTAEEWAAECVSTH